MPLLWLSLAFLIGTALGNRVQAPWLWLAAAAVAALGARAYLGSLNRPAVWLRFTPPRWVPVRPPVPAGLLLLVLALGGARASASLPALTPQVLHWYNDLKTELELEGQIVQPPERRDASTRLIVQIERLRPAGEEGAEFKPVQGLLVVEAHPGVLWQYGDRVLLQGQVETPREGEDFSYRKYLGVQGIYSHMWEAKVQRLERGGASVLGALFRLRERVFAVVRESLPDPESSLLAGILLGTRTGISPRLQADFQSTGTAHIIAISGFNMTLLSGLLIRLFGRRLGKRRGAVAAAIGIAAYTLLVGAGPAVVRAAALSGLSLLARQFGRQQDALNSLAFTGALMALHHPLVLEDVSFQLSFLATLGLVLYASSLSDGFSAWVGRRLPAPAARRLAVVVNDGLLLTLAAQITTLPVLLVNFGKLSPVSFLANFAILPAQPAVMILGGAAGLAGALWRPLALPFAALAWPFLAYTIRAVEWFARWPGASLAVGRPGGLFVLLYYALLFGLTAWLRRNQAQEVADAAAGSGSGGFSRSLPHTQPLAEAATPEAQPTGGSPAAGSGSLDSNPIPSTQLPTGVILSGGFAERSACDSRISPAGERPPEPSTPPTGPAVPGGPAALPDPGEALGAATNALQLSTAAPLSADIRVAPAETGQAGRQAPGYLRSARSFLRWRAAPTGEQPVPAGGSPGAGEQDPAEAAPARTRPGAAPGSGLAAGATATGMSPASGSTVATEEQETSRPTRLSAALRPGLLLAALSVIVLLIWQAALAAPDGKLHLTLLEVGSGDALLVETPTGRSILIDGGPSGRALGDGLGRRLPFLSGRLDWLVVAAPGQEQLGSLPLVLERFPPQQVLWAGQIPESNKGYSARELQEKLAERNIPIVDAETGMGLDLGQGAVLRVLAAGEHGAILELEWEEFHALLPVGQDVDTLATLLANRRLAHAEVLLLADCGWAELNPPEWIGKLQPQMVLLSVAPGDVKGRPDPKVLDVAEQYNLLRTDLDGWVEITTDGQVMWVEVERP